VVTVTEILGLEVSYLSFMMNFSWKDQFFSVCRYLSLEGVAENDIIFHV
jgi:hypothetical protein